jgi:hypothetical protein
MTQGKLENGTHENAPNAKESVNQSTEETVVSQKTTDMRVAFLLPESTSTLQNTLQEMMAESLGPLDSSSFVVLETLDEGLAFFRDHPEGVFFIPTDLFSQNENVTLLQKMSVWMPQVKLVAFDETGRYSQEVVDLMNQDVLFWKLNLNRIPGEEAFCDQESVEIVLKEAYQQQMDYQVQGSNPLVHTWQIPASYIERELFHLVETVSVEGKPCWELPVLMKRWAIAVGGDALEIDQAFWFGASAQVDLSQFWTSRVDLSVETLGWLITLFYEGRTGRWVDLFHKDKTSQHPLALPVPMGSPNLLQDEEMAQVLSWFSVWLSASEAERATMRQSGEKWFTPVHWKLIIDKLIMQEQVIDLETVFQDVRIERQAG